MPNLVLDLEINRVDLVDEGANSASFIEIFKRKESVNMDLQEILEKMKPEHVEVIQAELDRIKEELDAVSEKLETATSERDAATKERDEAKEELGTTNETLSNTQAELEELKAQCEADKAKSGTIAPDETETLKSLPEDVRAMFETIKSQKEAAEEELRKAKEAEQQAEAVAKANELKALPVEQDKLVEVVKGASKEVIDLLTVVNAALEGVVLGEVGKQRGDAGSADAWDKIEAKADELVKSESISKAKAITRVLNENPELYKEYLQGGAK